MLVAYDRTILRNFAGRLYIQAALLPILNALIGAALGTLAGWALEARRQPFLPPNNWHVIIGGIGLALGAAHGISAGARLRVMAQAALCAIAIEENTRTLNGRS